VIPLLKEERKKHEEEKKVVEVERAEGGSATCGDHNMDNDKKNENKRLHEHHPSMTPKAFCSPHLYQLNFQLSSQG